MNRTFRTSDLLNRKVFADFDRTRFPFYFQYIEYRSWPKKKASVKVFDPTYRSVYVPIKYYKPIHPFCTFFTNQLWKEHLASQKIAL